MLVLGIETSCDETSAALVEDGKVVLSNAIATQLDLLKKYGCDVVVLDWNMPELSGIDVLLLIRGSDRPTRVIMVTAENDKARITEAMESGVDDYLIKPFKPDQLVKKVRRVVPDAG